MHTVWELAKAENRNADTARQGRPSSPSRGQRLAKTANWIVLIGMVALIAGIAPQATAQSYAYVRSWPANGPGRFPLPYPEGIAFDAQGNAYYADFATHYVGKVDPSGNLVATWGGFGTGNGQFFHPEGVAVDHQGNVYVSDYMNNRIEKFTSNGTYLTQWGSQGSGDGQFQNPAGVAVDSANNVYVVDSGNARVEKFTSTGTYLAQWNSWAVFWTMVRPFDIAVDSQDNVYVSDLWTERYHICKFTSTGTFVAGWRLDGILEQTPGAGVSVSGLALDSSDDLYASADVIESDGDHISIQTDTSAGLYLTQWAEWRASPAGLTTGMAADASDNVYVGDPSNHQISMLSPSASFVGAWHMWGESPGQFRTPNAVALDSAGHVYVADTNNNRIQKFSSTGGLLNVWNQVHTDDKPPVIYEFVAPVAVAVDGSVIIIVTKYTEGQDSTVHGYSLLAFEGGLFLGVGPAFDTPTSMAVGNAGIYVVDAANYSVEWSVDGASMTKWGSQGTGDGEFESPYGVALDGAGNVYVTDTANRNVQVFTYNGDFLAKWPIKGNEPPYGIAVDKWGYVYVALGHPEVPDDLSFVNDYIQKYTTTGTFVAQWGAIGIGNGQFYGPKSVAVDSAGYVYVADTGNDRLQVFAPGPTVAMASSAPNPTDASPIPVTVTFSRPVTGFTSSDIATGNATVTDFVSASATDYSFDLVPSGQGVVTANIAAGVAVYTDGYGNMAAAPFSRTFDSIPPNSPQVTGSTLTTNTTPTWSWTSGGGGAGIYHYQLDSQTGAWSGTTGLAYTPAQPLQDGPHTLYVQERDTAGNWSASGSFTITVDTTPPAIRIGLPSVSNTAAGPVAFAVTYTGATNVFLSLENITLNKSGSANAIVGLSRLSPTSFIVTLSIITGQGALSISIAPGTAVDELGNQAHAAGPSAAVTVTPPPTDIDRINGINAVDVQLAINAALGLDIGGLDADVNRDGIVNAVDVQLTINAALGVTAM